MALTLPEIASYYSHIEETYEPHPDAQVDRMWRRANRYERRAFECLAEGDAERGQRWASCSTRMRLRGMRRMDMLAGRR